MNKFSIVLVLATMALAGANAQACPNIISRIEWGANYNGTSIPLPIRPAQFAVIHNAGTACTTQDECSAVMRSIQDMHMVTNGWSDIGYQFCIGGDGLVYEGRGWGRMGSHTPRFNNQSVGICFLGSFETELPSLAARNNAQALIRCGVTSGHIASAYWLLGHRQAVASDCPGTALFDELRTWPNFNPAIRPV